jgi:hypothetical protein
MLVIGLPAALIALLSLGELAGALRRDDTDDAVAPPTAARPTA